MKITAYLKNTATTHDVTVATAGQERTLAVPPKSAGGGSEVNGGEFLMLALATCYCNDLYREARRLGIDLCAVEVDASADFDGIGLGASNIQYQARITADATDAQVAQLLQETDAVAEVQNTLRAASQVTRVPWNG